MGGTLEGGKAAAATNKMKYGDDFYKRIGAEGGKRGKTGGFYAMVTCDKPDCEFLRFKNPHYIRQCAGWKGGIISRRHKAVKES